MFSLLNHFALLPVRRNLHPHHFSEDQVWSIGGPTFKLYHIRSMLLTGIT